jgi:hypothetical protein
MNTANILCPSKSESILNKQLDYQSIKCEPVHGVRSLVALSNNLQSSVKVKKDKVSLCLTKHHAMKTYWGVEV